MRRFVVYMYFVVVIYCNLEVYYLQKLTLGAHIFRTVCVVSMCSSEVRFLAASASFVEDSMLLGDQCKEIKVGISKN